MCVWRREIQAKKEAEERPEEINSIRLAANIPVCPSCVMAKMPIEQTCSDKCVECWIEAIKPKEGE